MVPLSSFVAIGDLPVAKKRQTKHCQPAAQARTSPLLALRAGKQGFISPPLHSQPSRRILIEVVQLQGFALERAFDMRMLHNARREGFLNDFGKAPLDVILTYCSLDPPFEESLFFD